MIMNNITLDAIREFKKNVQEDSSLEILKWPASLNWKNGTENHVSVRKFSPIVIDEPTVLGGTDTAANPLEYFLTGIVGCFTANFEILASQEGIVLEKVAVDIETDLNVAVYLGIKEGERAVQNTIIKLHAVTSAPIEKVKEVANLALTISPVVNSVKTKVDLIVE